MYLFISFCLNYYILDVKKEEIGADNIRLINGCLTLLYVCYLIGTYINKVNNKNKEKSSNGTSSATPKNT